MLTFAIFAFTGWSARAVRVSIRRENQIRPEFIFNVTVEPDGSRERLQSGI